jgi:hypothetical protein
MVFPSMFYQTVEPGLSGYTSPTNITWTTGAIPDPQESRVELIEALAELVKAFPADGSVWSDAKGATANAIQAIMADIENDYTLEEGIEEDAT